LTKKKKKKQGQRYLLFETHPSNARSLSSQITPFFFYETTENDA